MNSLLKLYCVKHHAFLLFLKNTVLYEKTLMYCVQDCTRQRNGVLLRCWKPDHSVCMCPSSDGFKIPALMVYGLFRFNVLKRRTGGKERLGSAKADYGQVMWTEREKNKKVYSKYTSSVSVPVWESFVAQRWWNLTFCHRVLIYFLKQQLCRPQGLHQYTHNALLLLYYSIILSERMFLNNIRLILNALKVCC